MTKHIILIVDDNEINAMLASRLAEAFGLESDVAANGLIATKMVKEKDYSFVLMDHVMDVMDGIEATGIISGECDVPIYAMTGDLTEQVRMDFFEAGAKGAMSKPLKAEEMLKVIENCIPEGEYSIDPALFGGRPVKKESEGDVLLREYMSEVNGLDFSKGIENSLGDEKKYVWLIKASAKNILQYIGILEDFMATNDYTKLKVASHSLKTVFSNIGMDGLRFESEKIERIADIKLAGNENVFRDDVVDYVNHAREAADELEQAISSYEQAVHEMENPCDYSVAEAPLSEEDLQSVTEYTVKAFERFEIDYILEGLDILKRATTNDDRRRIEEAIEDVNNFMYDAAYEKIADILKKGRGEAR